MRGLGVEGFRGLGFWGLGLRVKFWGRGFKFTKGLGLGVGVLAKDLVIGLSQGF